MDLKSASAKLVALAALLVAACSSTPPQAPAAHTPSVPTAQTVAPAPASQPGGATKPVAPAPAVLAAYLDPSSPIYRERSVYFDFDEALVRSDGMPVIERQGRYLSGHAQLKVRVEGNTDERGGSEYNLALGQRRAEAVRKALLLYGVMGSQVEAVSLGKERPKAEGHDEAAWAQNRRADIVYPPR